MNRNRDMMLREIQELDFRLYDLRLFLDTHPYDCQAAEAYRVTAAKGDAMRRHFEKLYGPLDVHSTEDEAAPYQWIKGPWPWEYTHEEKGEVNAYVGV